jgi:hypothetical protein
MSSRFPSLCLPTFLMVGAFVSSSFGQSPGKNPAAGNDPERPVQYISLQQAFEMAMKNEPVCQQNQITAEQLRILKPLPTGGVVFVTDYGVDQTETRISTVFAKAAEARKAGKTEVARAYYESICCLYPASKHAKEATRLLEEMKEPDQGETKMHSLKDAISDGAKRVLCRILPAYFPDPNARIVEMKDPPDTRPEDDEWARFWMKDKKTPLKFERITGSTGP